MLIRRHSSEAGTVYLVSINGEDRYSVALNEAAGVWEVVNTDGDMMAAEWSLSDALDAIAEVHSEVL